MSSQQLVYILTKELCGEVEKSFEYFNGSFKTIYMNFIAYSK